MLIPTLPSLRSKRATVATLAHERYFTELIQQEFSRLQSTGHTYLDYTGGGLYGASQIIRHKRMLLGEVFGNPHSVNPTSTFATHLTEEARQKVLQFFNAEDYYCIFTQNASGALKIVGESFPWEPGSQFLSLIDNHNSVTGIREFCKRAGGTVAHAPIRFNDLTINATLLSQQLSASCGRAPRAEVNDPAPPKLFAYPAQSNASGVKHNLAWVKEAARQGWYTLLDAAAFVPTNRLDLKRCRPDFVTLSFYKIFGYPTGLGCLLVRKDRFEVLRKPWFAGGTVRLAGVVAEEHRLHGQHERWEDGTINYLDLPAITLGLEFIEQIGMERITERVASLTAHLYQEVRELYHANGRPLVHIYGPTDRSECGGNFIFSVHDAAGRRIDVRQIDERAASHGISIRSGCFCNPGVDEVNHQVTKEELTEYFTAERGGDYHEMNAQLGKMRGATRVSVGVATSRQDLNHFIALLKTWLE